MYLSCKVATKEVCKTVNGNKLKGAAVSRGVTCRTLANAIRKNYATFSRKLTGKSSFTLEEVEKIADVLQLSREQVYEIFFE